MLFRFILSLIRSCLQLHMQYPPLPQGRPQSLTLSGEDPIKHWDEQLIPRQTSPGQEAFELDVIQRPSDVINRQPNDYVTSDPNINVPSRHQVPTVVKLPKQGGEGANNFMYSPTGDKEMGSKKPWSHHNNLNDSYFTPVKGNSNWNYTLGWKKYPLERKYCTGMLALNRKLINNQGKSI